MANGKRVPTFTIRADQPGATRALEQVSSTLGDTRELRAAREAFADWVREARIAADAAADN